jgi:hypothetical protein
MRTRISFAVAALFAIAVFTFTSPAQSSQPENSFEVTLSVISGSNDGGKADLPPALSPISKQLRSSFGLTNLRLADTYVGRIGNGGNIQYKSLANIDAPAQSDTPSFLDWQIAGLRNSAPGSGVGFFIQAFRFGARVPVRVASGPDANGKPTSTIQYESIGLNVDRLTLSENAPVLIGTIALPKADGGRVFLVLTVSPAAN